MYLDFCSYIGKGWETMKITKQGTKILFDGIPTYSDIQGSNPACHGLMMNMRMIQGVFDDKEDVSRFNRYGKTFCPEQNTEELIASLPAWYAHGIRAITVGFQGGGPCFTLDNYTIQNSPYSEDGMSMDEAYLRRMKRIILAADAIGMVVIVSLFYGAQTRFLKDDDAVYAAVKTASNFLRDEQFTNVIIEIANEYDITCFNRHPVLHTPKGIVYLIEVAQRESGGMYVGCSGTGGHFNEEICKASDIILIHGNDNGRQRVYNLIEKCKQIKPARPIVINEDSQALGNMAMAVDSYVSWGYYNNMTKQEPPTYWEITKGEDEFFALRTSEMLGLTENKLSLEDQFYLQGLESHMTYDGKRWIRLASLYPEKILCVAFYRNGEFVGKAWDDPFMLNSVGSNWLQMAFPEEIKTGETWKAVITLVTGETVEKTATV